MILCFSTMSLCAFIGYTIFFWHCEYVQLSCAWWPHNSLSIWNLAQVSRLCYRGTVQHITFFFYQPWHDVENELLPKALEATLPSLKIRVFIAWFLILAKVCFRYFPADENPNVASDIFIEISSTALKSFKRRGYAFCWKLSFYPPLNGASPRCQASFIRISLSCFSLQIQFYWFFSDVFEIRCSFWARLRRPQKEQRCVFSVAKPPKKHTSYFVHVLYHHLLNR